MTFGAGASWADGSLKDGPAPAAAVGCTGQYSGAYIGGQVGYLDHDSKFHDELGTGHVSGDDSGVTFGFFSGYNVQCGRLLVGIESDFNYADTDAKWSDCCQDLSSEMNWFGTARLRAGLVHNENILFFVTGGLAYADLDRTFAVGAPLNFRQSDGDTEFGWTLGGGFEFLRDGKWSFKAEALYVDLGDKSISYEDTTGCAINCTARIGYEDDFWTARIGINYHFGRREEVAAPLK